MHTDWSDVDSEQKNLDLPLTTFKKKAGLTEKQQKIGLKSVVTFHNTFIEACLNYLVQ